MYRCSCQHLFITSDLSSPINPEAKRVYDRDFLMSLQNVNASKLKPDGLPVLSEILLTKPLGGSSAIYAGGRRDLNPDSLKPLQVKANCKAVVEFDRFMKCMYMYYILDQRFLTIFSLFPLESSIIPNWQQVGIISYYWYIYYIVIYMYIECCILWHISLEPFKSVINECTVWKCRNMPRVLPTLENQFINCMKLLKRKTHLLKWFTYHHPPPPEGNPSGLENARV